MTRSGTRYIASFLPTWAVLKKKWTRKRVTSKPSGRPELTGGGTSKWRIIAQVKQKKDGTLVLFKRDVEETAGKGLSGDESIDADNLYQQLEDKLK